MTQITSLEESYLSLVEFLMMAKQRLFEIGNDFDMSGMQATTLLMMNEPRPMHYFTKFFNCDPSNITGIIDALEDKGLVSRTESSNDRRIKLVKLLPAGQKIRSAMLVKLTTDESYLLSKLTKPEAETFTKLVQKITHA